MSSTTAQPDYNQVLTCENANAEDELKANPDIHDQLRVAEQETISLRVATVICSSCMKQ